MLGPTDKGAPPYQEHHSPFWPAMPPHEINVTAAASIVPNVVQRGLPGDRPWRSQIPSRKGMGGKVGLQQQEQLWQQEQMERLPNVMRSVDPCSKSRYQLCSYHDGGDGFHLFKSTRIVEDTSPAKVQQLYQELLDFFPTILPRALGVAANE
jgi:hypothetical protein